MQPSNKIIAVLIVLAILLGLGIYYKNRNFNQTNNPSSNGNTQTPVPASDQELTAEQKALLNTPGKDATKAQLDAFSTLVAKFATAGDTVTIKDCTANPVVLKAKYGSTITVNNTGTTDIHFGVQDERTLVAAGKSAKIKTDYKNGVGIYGYGCDDTTLSRAIGILLLTE